MKLADILSNIRGLVSQVTPTALDLALRSNGTGKSVRIKAGMVCTQKQWQRMRHKWHEIKGAIEKCEDIAFSLDPGSKHPEVSLNLSSVFGGKKGEEKVAEFTFKVNAFPNTEPHCCSSFNEKVYTFNQEKMAASA